LTDDAAGANEQYEHAEESKMAQDNVKEKYRL